MFIIEEESGTYRRPLRRHDGYYAGDFKGTEMCSVTALSALSKLQPPTFASPEAA